jgi:MFS family permease
MFQQDTISDNSSTAKNNWSIPIFAVLITMLVSALPMAGLSVLFKEISQDLKLSVVQIGLIWGMLSFGSIFGTVLAGLLCDHYGTKRIVFLQCILGGISAVFVGISNGFFSLAVTIFLGGLFCMSLIPSLNLVVSQYSSPQRQGLAQSFITFGGGSGLMLGSLISATLLSPWLGGWRHVYFLFGGVAIVLGLVWLFVLRKHERGRVGNSFNVISLLQAYKHLLGLKSLWLIMLSMLAYQCSISGVTGFLPYYLEDSGWSVIAASGSLAALTAAVAVGSFPLALLSDRIGSRKTPIMVGLLAVIAGFGLLSVIHNWILWILVISAGFISAGCASLLTAMCIEDQEVGRDYSGTAVGLMLCLTGIGRTLTPPIGNSLAGISSTIAWPFIFWAGLAAAGAIVLVFVKETGRRNESKRIQ